MKTISVMTVMLLTLAFARPASARDKSTLFQAHTVQPAPEGNIIVDSSGHGFLTLAKLEQDARKARVRAAQRQQSFWKAKAEAKNHKTTKW